MQQSNCILVLSWPFLLLNSINMKLTQNWLHLALVPLKSNQSGERKVNVEVGCFEIILCDLIFRNAMKNDSFPLSM